MKCFVIMPFAPAFDDVFKAIKEHAQKVDGVSCSRLDEAQPAGRITHRLLSELKNSGFCVADITNFNPNVMWETGYAMALGKPIIIVTQSTSELPFDMKDLQSVSYDRERLHATLGEPLVRVVRDTVEHMKTAAAGDAPQASDPDSVIRGLADQVTELKNVVAQLVKGWSDRPRVAQVVSDQFSDLKALVGAWRNQETDSYAYIQAIDGRLVAPYCYGGNHSLTGYYHDWRMVGDYHFGRYRWLREAISGFTFLKQVDADTFRGAWWYDGEKTADPDEPLTGSGHASTWVRASGAKTPLWALEFFDEVRQGLVAEYQ